MTIEGARSEGNLAVICAAANGHVGVLRELRKGWGLNTNDARADNNRAIRVAARRGQVKVLQELRKNWGLTAVDAGPERSEIIMRRTAIYYAAANGHVEVLRELRELREWGLTAEDAMVALSARLETFSLATRNLNWPLIVEELTTVWGVIPEALNEAELGAMYQARPQEEPWVPLSSSLDQDLALNETDIQSLISDGSEGGSAVRGQSSVSIDDRSSVPTECTICQNSLFYKLAGGEGLDSTIQPVVTGCGHVFHEDCLERTRQRFERTNCPNCRGLHLALAANCTSLSPSAAESAKAFITSLIDLVEIRRAVWRQV